MAWATATARVVVTLTAVGLSIACTRTEPARDTTAATSATAEPRTDAQITTMVQAKYFADDSIRSRDIDVETENGRVTLRGTVADDASKQRAVTLARGVEGVKDVNEELQVRSESTTARREPPNSRVGEVGTSGTEINAPWWITTKIQAQYFVSPEIKPWTIDVTTQSGGAVTLEGTVDSADDRAEAVRIARTTEGVTRVEDRLRIDPNASRDRTTSTTIEPPDPWLTAKIQAKYFLDADVKGSRIDVDTRTGVVTLSGTVRSEAERRQAVALARNTEGVRDVKDALRVDATGEAGDRGRPATAIERPDAWLTTKIQAAYYLDPDVKGHQINVDTNRGVVTLKGYVDTAAQKQEAEQIARETEGVRRVVNQLTIGARE